MHFRAQPLPEPYAPAERRTLQRLNTPEKIQRFLDEDLVYNKEPHGVTCYSPRLALRHRLAHCVEGAMLAAAALEFHGHPPLLFDLEAVRDDDHVLAVYRVNGLWGAIAKSNYSGLRSRTPIYRTLRELAISYFEHYYNPRGEKTLRGYARRPLNLNRFNAIQWRTSTEQVWDVPMALVDVPHVPILPGNALTRRYRMDQRLYDAGFLGARL